MPFSHGGPPSERLYVEDLARDGPRDDRLAGDAGRPLVLVHGFTGDASTWIAFAAAFGSSRPLWAVELPGHGRSRRQKTASVESAAKAVADAFADAQAADAQANPSGESGAADRPVQPVHWVGYSMGSRIALRVACDQPSAVASLILVSATPGIVDSDARAARREADDAWAASLRDNGLEAFVDAWLAQPLFSSLSRLGPQARVAAREQRLRNDPEGLSAALRAMGTGAMEPLWDRLRGLDMPVLLLTGELDERFTAIAKAMAAAVPRARHVVVPKAGHAVQTEAPEAMAVAVREFLLEVEGPPLRAE